MGASGRLVSLISGGIDSPVASYRMMQRGCRLIFVHFHSSPFLDRSSQEKSRALVEMLTRYQFVSRLYLVPFGEIQRRIVAAVLRPLRVVIYRRMMLRIASVIAAKERARALVTGESLAQVASQTLPNIAVIEEAARPAGAAPPHRYGQAGDHRPGHVHRHLRDLGPTRPGLLPALRTQTPGGQGHPAAGARGGSRPRCGRARPPSGADHVEVERFHYPEPDKSETPTVACTVAGAQT